MPFNFRNLSLYEAYYDIVNYREFIKTIKREKANKESLYNKFQLKHNLFYNIYGQISLIGEEEKLPDNIKQMAIMEKLIPINKYFDETLNFGEYLDVDFFRFAEVNGEVTNSYGFMYIFKFKKLSFKFIFKLLLIAGLLFLFKDFIFNLFAQWI